MVHKHYKKRLQTIHASPELKEAAAMFAPVLQSQAKKRIPMIEETEIQIKEFLLGSISSKRVEENLEILEKALECRKSDIDKGISTSNEYFIKLLGNVQESTKDTEDKVTQKDTQKLPVKGLGEHVPAFLLR